jgi:hypothetical protein
MHPCPGASPDHAIIAPGSEHHNDCSAMRCKCNARSIHPLVKVAEPSQSLVALDFCSSKKRMGLHLSWKTFCCAGGGRDDHVVLLISWRLPGSWGNVSRQ